MGFGDRARTALRSAKILTAVGVLVPLGMSAIAASMLLDMRRDAYGKAEQGARNLLHVIESDVARNVELLDLSLKGVIENMSAPGVASVDPRVRQMVLFDRAASARGVGSLLLLDASGSIVADAGAFPPRTASNGDREYFRAHVEDRDRGLFVGKPIVSRLTGDRTIPFSRRVDGPGGSFSGVAMGSLKLSYFSSLFERVDLGKDGAINLYLLDGTRIARQPFGDADVGANIGDSANFRRFVRERRGYFVGTSVRDGVERGYAFARIGDLPFVLNVAVSTSDIEREWRARAAVVGLSMISLCMLAAAMTFMFGRELRRRAALQREFGRLSTTDALTGLPNRRAFDAALEKAWAVSRRDGTPLSVLMVDADRFKSVNDGFGHAAGDALLRALGKAVAEAAMRPGDVVCRVGGEEFAAILPGADAPGALAVAERVHREVARMRPGAPYPAGRRTTVSVGVASTTDGERVGAADMVAAADEALYAAKEGGRNRTESAAGGEGRPAPAALAALS